MRAKFPLKPSKKTLSLSHSSYHSSFSLFPHLSCHFLYFFPQIAYHSFPSLSFPFLQHQFTLIPNTVSHISCLQCLFSRRFFLYIKSTWVPPLPLLDSCHISPIPPQSPLPPLHPVASSTPSCLHCVSRTWSDPGTKETIYKRPIYQ